MVHVSIRFLLAAVVGTVLVGALLWVARVEHWWGKYVTGGTVEGETEYVRRERPSGFTRWLTTVNHRDIGFMYMVYSAVVFGAAGAAALLMRTELLTPNAKLLSLDMYNSLFTVHGLTMLLLFGTPATFAFANYFVPLLIGASDMAYPRINAIAFWLLPVGALLVWSGYFFVPFHNGIGPAKIGWTMYVPLSIVNKNPGIDLLLLGLHLTGLSSTMAAINVIVTIFTQRSPDVSWANLDIFSWTMLTTSGQILFAFPLLGATLVMLLLDRNFGTSFYALKEGGALLWQHLFWFFGHPEVYILILPAMGLVSLIIPRFAGRRLYGFKAVVYSTLCIGVLSFGVWAHHMFATGLDPRVKASFMAVTLAIAIPSAVKVFNWTATIYNADLRLNVPMLFSIGFVSNFIIGGITGVFQASVPYDLIVHDTYWVVGHFHYIFMGGTVFMLFAGLYYWFPIFTGRTYNKVLGHVHFWLSMIGTNITFFTMLLLGYTGMPRRYATYLPKFATLHRVTSFGAYIIAVGQVVWIINMAYSWYNGNRVESSDPWNLREDGLLTREWDWFEWHDESNE